MRHEIITRHEAKWAELWLNAARAHGMQEIDGNPVLYMERHHRYFFEKLNDLETADCELILDDLLDALGASRSWWRGIVRRRWRRE